MEKVFLEKSVSDFIESGAGNYISKEAAMRADLAGMKIFDEPAFGYASANDPLFDELKKPDVIGPHLMLPAQWLPGAKSVVCMFLPFTGRVRDANRKNMDWPADEWMHARVEGQAFQDEICRYAISILESEGFAAIAPMIDRRFSRNSPFTRNADEQKYYTSNWSERHASYIAGLGTFGLSKGMITAKGTAGRYLSFITTSPFEANVRPYSGIFDYCIKCGACARNCPAKAISAERGKIHSICTAFVNRTQEKHNPRFGCGKCQVKVPCEAGIPNRDFIKHEIN